MKKRLAILVISSLSMASGLGPAFAGCSGGGSAINGYTPPSSSASVALAILNPTDKPITPVPAAQANIPAITPAAPAPAAPAAGKVVWIKGNLKVVGLDKQVRTLKSGDPILSGDTIVTDDKSQAEVAFTDHTVITFGKSTVFNVTKYEYHPEAKTGSVGKYVTNLLEGSFRTVTGAIAKTHPDDYQVNTEVAIMGVRGTDYGGAFHGCKVSMKYYSGTPIVHNSQGTLVLTAQSPYVSVDSANVAPVAVHVEPPIFKNTLPIVSVAVAASTIAPVTSLETPLKKGSGEGGSGGGSGGSCAKGSGGAANGFSVNYH